MSPGTTSAWRSGIPVLDQLRKAGVCRPRNRRPRRHRLRDAQSPPFPEACCHVQVRRVVDPVQAFIAQDRTPIDEIRITEEHVLALDKPELARDQAHASALIAVLSQHVEVQPNSGSLSSRSSFNSARI